MAWMEELRIPLTPFILRFSKIRQGGGGGTHYMGTMIAAGTIILAVARPWQGESL